MPRHRKERVPSHRALRHADNPARRARLMPAVNTSIAVLFHSTGDDPDTADTVPLPSPVHYRRVDARADTHPAKSGTGVLRTAARGLLVTPWFAAASGFVIAASLWIYVPHAHLQFPSGSAIQSQHCSKNCAQASSGKDSGRLATSGKGKLTEPAKSGKRAGARSRGVRDARSAVTGLTFSYYVLPSQHGRFMIRISVVSQHAIKDWRLAFVLPGDRIRQVWGARWHRTRPDSGTVSGGSQPEQSNGNGQGDGSQFGPAGQQYGFTFLVSGSGQPTRPMNCVYNGQSCTITNGQPGSS
jgi:hypothetical protein